MNHTAWAHLPNAALIDQIIHSFQTQALRWGELAANDRAATLSSNTWNKLTEANLRIVRDEWWEALYVITTVGTSGRIVCDNVIIALVLWPESVSMLKAPHGHIELLAALGSEPANLLIDALSILTTLNKETV